MPCRRHEPISMPGCRGCAAIADWRADKKYERQKFWEEEKRQRDQEWADGELGRTLKRLKAQAAQKEAEKKARKAKAKADAKQEAEARRVEREKQAAAEKARLEAFYATPAGQEQLAREKAEQARQEAEARAERAFKEAEQEAYRANYLKGLGRYRRATESEASRAGLEAAIATFVLLMVALLGGGQQLHWLVGAASIAGIVTIFRRYMLGGKEHGQETQIYQVIAKALFVPVVLLGGLTIPYAAAGGWWLGPPVVGSLIFCGYAFIAGRKAYRKLPIKVRDDAEPRKILFPWT